MNTFDYLWDEIHKETEWGRYPSEEVIRFVARNFYNKDRRKISILDVGCGTGAISWYLAKEGFNTYGFDGSPTAIEKAKLRMKEENVSAMLEVSDAGEMPYKDEAFDGVIDSAVIYANTKESIVKILRECYRVLKVKGKFFSTGLFNDKTTGYNTGEEIEKNTYKEIKEGIFANRGTVHLFTEKEIIELWSLVGFKNISVDSLERSEFGGKYKVAYFMVSAEK